MNSREYFYSIFTVYIPRSMLHTRKYIHTPWFWIFVNPHIYQAICSHFFVHSLTFFLVKLVFYRVVSFASGRSHLTMSNVLLHSLLFTISLVAQFCFKMQTQSYNAHSNRARHILSFPFRRSALQQLTYK